VVAAAGCTSALDLETAREYPCVPDAGVEDACPQGFRCGLEGYCHDTAVAAAYLCREDADCEAGWRCSLEGRCASPAGEALLPVSPGPLALARASPRLVQREPEQVAVMTGGGDTAWALAVVEDGGLTLAESRFLRPSTWLLAPMDGLQVSRLPAPAGVRGLAVGVTAGGSSGVYAYVQHGAGAGVVAAEGAPFAARADAFAGVTGERMEMVDGLHWGASFAGSQGWVLALREAAAAPIHAPATLNDLVAPRRQTTARRCLLAATPEGLYAAAVDAHALALTPLVRTPHTHAACAGAGTAAPGQGACTACTQPGLQGCESCGDGSVYCRGRQADGGMPWLPLVLGGGAVPHARCADTARFGVPGVRSLHTTQEGLMAVVAERPDGGQEVTLWSAEPGRPDSPTGAAEGCGRVDFCGEYLPNRLRLHAASGSGCAPCPSGLRVAEVRPQSVEAMQVLCEEPGGARRQVVTEVSFSGWDDHVTPLCTMRPLAPSRAAHQGPLQDRVRVVSAAGESLVLRGEHGQLWFGPDLQRLGALTTDVAPGVVLGEGERTLLFHDDRYAALEPGVGFRPRRLDGALAPGQLPAAHVEGAPDLAVLADGTVSHVAPDGGFPQLSLASLGSSVRSFSPPHLAARTDTPDGGTLVVASAYDALLSVELHGARPEPFPSRALAARVVPAANAPVLSLALQPAATLGGADGGGLYAAGYALTPGAVFRLTAGAENRWQARALPLAPGNPLEVWTEAGRGRVGYDDGRVYSLPGVFLLAPALPAAEAGTAGGAGGAVGGAVADFATWRGELFALAPGGLFRLAVPQGAAVGRWEAVPLAPALLPGAGPVDLAGGRLHATAQELWLFTRHGAALQLTRP
jgi:hypothetical protein